MTKEISHKTAGESQPKRCNWRMTYWIASFELLIAFAIADAVVIAWVARLMTGGQICATFVAYMITASGILATSCLVEAAEVREQSRGGHSEIRTPHALLH